MLARAAGSAALTEVSQRLGWSHVWSRQVEWERVLSRLFVCLLDEVESIRKYVTLPSLLATGKAWLQANTLGHCQSKLKLYIKKINLKIIWFKLIFFNFEEK